MSIFGDKSNIELASYKGVRIQLSGGYHNFYHNFVALFPAKDGEEGFDEISKPTHAAVIEYIDNRVKAEAKATVLSLPVLVTGNKGVRPGVITGINLHTGKVTGIKGIDRYDRVELYPRVPWVSDHIERIRVLDEERNRLNADLAKVRIGMDRGYRISVDTYEAELTKLVAAHQKAVNSAEEMHAHIAGVAV